MTGSSKSYRIGLKPIFSKINLGDFKLRKVKKVILHLTGRRLTLIYFTEGEIGEAQK